MLSPIVGHPAVKMHPNDIAFCVKTIRTLSHYSRAMKARVGCVLWHHPSRRIISMGYNGTPAGTDNTMEHLNITRPEVIHAEINTLGKLSWWERVMLMRQCVLFVTHTPCHLCAHTIVRHHIPLVYYLDVYGNTCQSHQVFHDSHTSLVRILEQ